MCTHRHIENELINNSYDSDLWSHVEYNGETGNSDSTVVNLGEQFEMSFSGNIFVQ